ncbi:hypothetical protein CROQUDRAFT_96464 [Cronartium quercuum f. sp. fusiforme G11]|uniref:Uncharacterized protein n=1 Tax=Cronartium quercuum f. sp. fusiforme G11 TaxID=708437 RepID=A0A9P6NFX1_9BASI|nr:hypothetical protein CROQUDRAFT_96464 [Cronartium quercuum f. sp. fusiforme G11]
MGHKSATYPLPPPSDDYHSRSIQQFVVLDNDPLTAGSSHVNIPLTNIHGMKIMEILDHDYILYIIGAMHTHGILYFTLDWFGNFDNQFNQLMAQFFLKVWKWGLRSNWFTVAAKEEAQRIHFDDVVLTAIFAKYFEYLKSNYKKLCKNTNALVMDQQKIMLSAALLQVCSLLFLIYAF